MRYGDEARRFNRARGEAQNLPRGLERVDCSKPTGWRRDRAQSALRARTRSDRHVDRDCTRSQAVDFDRSRGRRGRFYAGNPRGNGAKQRAAGYFRAEQPHVESRVHCRGCVQAHERNLHLRQRLAFRSGRFQREDVRHWAGQ